MLEESIFQGVFGDTVKTLRQQTGGLKMCTSIAMTGNEFYFGRNLDLEYSFGEKVFVTPRNYPIARKTGDPLEHHYAMIGMAGGAEDYPLYAEAANEKGLCMAGLNFPGNARYAAQAESGRENLTPYELILWVLGTCASVDEAKRLLENTRLTAIPFREGLPVAPLHWHIADREQSIVVESCADGLHVYDNPAGVLTNNPPFPYHLTNLRCYLNLTAKSPENRFGGGLGLEPFGQGMGAIGLPGDFSPSSRFVKASFLRENSAGDLTPAQFFHILDAVAMVRGAVVTPEGRCDITAYSCCIDADHGIYYYKTYENNQIAAVDLFREDLDGRELKRYELIRDQQIRWVNR